MKWFVRITAGVVIAALALTAFGHGNYLRATVGAMLAVLFCVGLYEGIDMGGFWGEDDDDDDGQGPFRPA